MPKSNQGKLKILKSTVEVRYVRGYKYIDLVGEFLNSVHDLGVKVSTPQFDPNGLIMKLQNEGILKITPNNYVMSFDSPMSLDLVKDNFVKYFDLINKIFKPVYTRIGWRTQYITYENNIKGISLDTNLSEFDIEEFKISKKYDNSNVIFSQEKVIEIKNKSKGVLYDIDIFYESGDYITFNEVEKKLIDYKEYLKNDNISFKILSK